MKLVMSSSARHKPSGPVIHTYSIGADAHWNPACEDPSYAAVHYNTRYQEGQEGCGVGQSVAFLTGGEARVVLGDYANVSEFLLEDLRRVARPEGVPWLAH